MQNKVGQLLKHTTLINGEPFSVVSTQPDYITAVALVHRESGEVKNVKFSCVKNPAPDWSEFAPGEFERMGEYIVVVAPVTSAPVEQVGDEEPGMKMHIDADKAVEFYQTLVQLLQADDAVIFTPDQNGGVIVEVRNGYYQRKKTNAVNQDKSESPYASLMSVAGRLEQDC